MGDNYSVKWKTQCFALAFLLLVLSEEFYIKPSSASSPTKSPKVTHNDNYEVAKTLEWLTLGEHPAPILERLKNKNIPNSEIQENSQGHGHLLMSSEGGSSIKDLPPVPPSTPDFDPLDYFTEKSAVKHFFNYDNLPKGEPIPSNIYERLVSDPALSCQYLIDLNLRFAFYYDVLPNYKDYGEFKKWMKEEDLEGKRITILLEDPEKLIRDEYIRTAEPNELITTEKEYDFIVYEFYPKKTNNRRDIIIDPSAKTKPQFKYDIEVKISKGRGQLEVRKDGNLRIKHIKADGPDSSWRKSQAYSFTLTDEEQKAISETKEHMKVEINENQDERSELVTEENIVDTHNKKAMEKVLGAENAKKLNKIIESRVSPSPDSGKGPSGNKGGGGGEDGGDTGGGAHGSGDDDIFHVDPETGEVTLTDPDKFLEKYNTATEAERKRMAEIVSRIDPEKLTKLEESGVNMGKIRNLVEFEQLKTQVEQVHAMDDLTNMENGHKVPPIEKFAIIDEKFSGGKIRFSPTRLAKTLANSEGSLKFQKGVGVLGYAFLAKGFFDGVENHDWSSVGILTGFTAFNAGASGVKLFEDFLTKSLKMGKFCKFVEKYAGPFGAALDVGLSAWSFTNSIIAYSQSTNKYDSEDAIVDIVASTVNLLIAGAVLAFSFVAPGLAMAVGFVLNLVVSFFSSYAHTQILVSRMHARIGLTAQEEIEVKSNHFWDWLGIHKDDYRDYLLKEQDANNLVVENSLEVLKNNSQLRGLAIPSRSLMMAGSCHLTRSSCAFYSFGCWHWVDDTVLGRGCEQNRPCPHLACTDSYSYDTRYLCHCDGSPHPQFGDPRPDQFIDFRSKQQVYHDRADPIDINSNRGEFLCKPGSLESMGSQTSKDHTEEDRLCENAMALVRPRNQWTQDQIMLIRLEDGNDVVYCNTSDSTPNMFHMGNKGVKKFIANKTEGFNNFFFGDACNATLSGRFVGGASEKDAITVAESCGKGNTLEVDLLRGQMFLGSSFVNMSFDSIEEVIARKGETDIVTAASFTRFVATQGGTKEKPDEILMPKDAEDKSFNMTLSVSEFTKVNSEVKKGNLTFFMGDRTQGVEINLDVYTNSTPKTSFLFYTMGSQDLGYLNLTQTESKVTLKLASRISGNSSAVLNFFNRTEDNVTSLVPSIFFAEKPTGSTQSALVLNSGTKGQPFVYHSLSGGNFSEPQNRNGSTFLPNVFEVLSDGWKSLVGGSSSDQFILRYPVTEIHGGDGEDTIRLHENLTQPLEIDLTDQRRFTGIENVIGSPGNSLKVVASCDTKTIAALGGGGSETNVEGQIPGDDAAVKVTIPDNLSCAKRELQILAKGASTVEINSPVTNFTTDAVTVVVVGRNSSDLKDHPLNVDITTQTNNTKGLGIILETPHKNWTFVEVEQKLNNVTSAKDNLRSMEVHLRGSEGITDGTEESLRFSFAVSRKRNKSEGKFSSETPAIQLMQIHKGDNGAKEPPAQLLLEAETGRPTAYFILGENATKIQGYLGLTNVFQVHNGSWVITGGDLDDSIYLIPSAHLNTKVDLGAGQNTLVLEDDSDAADEVQKKDKKGTFLVNLEKGRFGYLQTPEFQKGYLDNIQEVIGRTGKTDILHATCSTKLLNGGGGSGAETNDTGKWDTIYISGSGCTGDVQDITIVAPDTTRVRNAAITGKFAYFIGNLSTTDVQLNSTTENLHGFHFQFNAWDEIDYVAFDVKTKQIGFRRLDDSKNENSSGVYLPMARKNQTEDYTNPTFEFRRPGSNVVTAVNVAKDGVVTSTYVIRHSGLQVNETVKGLHLAVNRFLINITETRNSSVSGAILGSSGAGANQFWIYNLQTPLQSLDGGPCGNCSNYLHLQKDFRSSEPLEIDLDIEGGFMKTSNGPVIKSLRNINSFYGRSSNSSQHGVDKVTVTCATKTVIEVEDVIVRYQNGVIGHPCQFNLAIGVDANTSVWFTESNRFSRKDYNESLDTFNYLFSTPRSFDPMGDLGFPKWWNGPTHNYFFSFKADDLEWIGFDKQAEKLCYTLKNISSDGGQFCHSMISNLGIIDAYYAQPSMLTKDGFQIRVSRVGAVELSLGASKSFPSQEIIESQVIPSFEILSRRLDVPIIVQTDKDFLYVGHDDQIKNGSSYRNVLENVKYSTSHLVGAAMPTTIYRIASLVKDVYIYPGYAGTIGDHDMKSLVGWAKSKQTLDLSEVLMDIRRNTGKKFVPEVKQFGDDLVITMNPFEKQYPARLTIVNGTRLEFWSEIQVLLHTTMMDFTVDDLQNWKLKPRAIEVPQGFLYNVAPEELEDGQRITFSSDHGHTAKFVAARNNTHLYISNVLKERNEDTKNGTVPTRGITTLLINNFFETKEWRPPPKPEDIHPDKPLEDFSVPAKISHVRLSFPGLELDLNDGRIFHADDLQEVTPQDWNCVLYEAQQKLLHDLPQIIQSQNFTCENLLWASVGIGLMVFLVVTLLMTIGVIFWRRRLNRQRQLGEYQILREERPNGYGTM